MPASYVTVSLTLALIYGPTSARGVGDALVTEFAESYCDLTVSYTHLTLPTKA